MDTALESFVQDLKEQMHEETREAYGDTAYQRWLNPLYNGTIADPDAYARVRGVCGDSMEIYLSFQDGRVKDSSYQTDGCGSSTVCGSVAAEIALGKDPSELLEITGELILKSLRGLPKEDEQCAHLASETLHAALNSYMSKKARIGK